MSDIRPPVRPQSSSSSGFPSRIPPLNLEALTAARDYAADDPDVAALDRAQDVIYDAWDADGRSDGTMAQRALTISPLCTDAHTLLAEQPTTSDADAITLYRLGTRAGQLAPGTEFETLHGEFWGWLQTRPYMRTRAGLADALYRTGAHDQALDHWRAMLDLNPNDNQGVRYSLVLALLRHGGKEEVRDILDRYDDDAGIIVTYTRALLAFRDRQPDASELLVEAVRSNRHVPAMLARTKRGKSSNNRLLTMGGVDEATWYVREAGDAWRATDGAVGRLVELAATVPPGPK